MRRLGIFALLFASTLSFAQKPLTVTIIHTNDLHAHVEPTPIRGKTYGGYARIATLVKQIRAKEKNTLFLCAGDVFQGTLYFNEYEGLADVNILNRMGLQAACLGNHEFDRGIPTLVQYIKHANYPVLAANIDTTPDPSFGAVLKPYTIIEVAGQKVGIVGLVTKDTPNITMIGDRFKFEAHLSAAQRYVDQLTAQGVNKIIVLSHIGYEEDQELARGLHNVDIIVGGHSHTPLGTPEVPGWRASQGAYPTITKDADGHPVYIVQAFEWGKVLGEIKFDFDAKGQVTRVVSGAPIPVTADVPEDPEIAGLVDAFRKPITAIGSQQIGVSNVAMTDHTQVGYIISDSYLDVTSKLGVVAAFMNPGGVRSNLEAGKITYGAANTICPFRNTITIAELTGAEIVSMLNDSHGSLIPSIGTSFHAGESVSDVVIGGQPLDPTKTYKIAVNNFMAGGGDGLTTLKNCTKKTDTGLIDIDAFVDFIKKTSPIQPVPSPRIIR